MNPTEATALLALVGKRIAELRTVRRWYRENRWATWTDTRKAQEAELRALLTLARAARKAARVEGADALTAAKGYAEAYPIGVGYHDTQSERFA